MSGKQTEWIGLLLPAALAALLQFAAPLADGKLPPRQQMIGAVIIAAIVASMSSLALQEWLHLNVVQAGLIGTVTGFIPAARWVRVANKALEAQMRERLKVELEQEAEQKEVPADV
ncbi:hypothetical protein D3875_04135 [Deinococcus cavernae]|uniref:Holin n=1 Tax=Deinococcus cavernae TaxID=2320857 RepID=A0A418VEE0_9DEIO|nr:hypothetical protein [Deinococcus cavernae]RJF74476.1 hypothetical protein D3875_04135 [Deinococcus cavernae]